MAIKYVIIQTKKGTHMQTVSIQTNASVEVLESIKSLLLNIDPDMTMSYENQRLDVSEKDAQDFKDLHDRLKNCELNYISHEEFIKNNTQHLKSLGAKV